MSIKRLMELDLKKLLGSLDNYNFPIENLKTMNIMLSF
jgi:hypothetical protein